MDRFIDEYRAAMQVIIDRNLQGLEDKNVQLLPTQKLNKVMKFVLEFDEYSYRKSNSLVARLTESERKKLTQDLLKVGDQMKQEAKDIINAS